MSLCVKLLWWLELRVEFIDEVFVGRLENSVNNVTHKVFQSIEQLVEGDESTLSFEMSVLSLDYIVLIVNIKV